MPGPDRVNNALLELLEWIGSEPRPSVAVLEAWRGSWPRLPLSEEANDLGFTMRHRRSS